MKLGLALSGGGLRGAAHVGVLKALLENNIKPDMIAGTSSGSMIAAFYATGMSVDEMIKRAPEINYSLIDIDYFGIIKYLLRISPDFEGLVKGERFQEYLRDLTEGKKMYQTDIPLGIIAADIETGKKIIYSSQELELSKRERRWIFQMPIIDSVYMAVRASSSIPIVFKSVKAYRFNLVDGGIRDNIPVQVLKNKMGADKVIAVNLGFTGQRESRINTFTEYVAQTIDIMGQEASRNKLNNADYVIKPKIYNISSTDFSMLGESIERGYNQTSKCIEEIKEVLVT